MRPPQAARHSSTLRPAELITLRPVFSMPQNSQYRPVEGW